jgi:hypothetical protein
LGDSKFNDEMIKTDFELKWTGDSTLFIKNKDRDYYEVRSMKLNIFNDIYDESGAACHSFVLKDRI